MIKAEKTRLHLLNILKALVLFSIVTLHANEFIFWEDDPGLRRNTPIWYYAYFLARIFAIGGQQLVTLTYLLFGYSGKSRKNLFYIALFALLGQLLLGFALQWVEWDIYAFIAVSNLLILGIPFLYRFNYPVLILSFLALWIPTTLIQEMVPEGALWVILTGKLTDYNSGSWALLPWVFLPIFSYQLGLLIKMKGPLLQRWWPQEWWIWTPLFLVSTPVLGYFLQTPVGPSFYQFNFNAPPHIYWANILPFYFLIRLSFLSSLQNWLDGSSIIRGISNFYWLKNVGITYLLSVLYLGIGAQYPEVFRSYPVLFDLYYLSIIPVCEIISRLFYRWKKKKIPQS